MWPNRNSHARNHLSKIVVQHSTEYAQDQLVAVSQYHRGEVIGYPIAVGHAAISSAALKQADELDAKGKAVYVLHTWKDHLWDMGVNKKLEVPEPRPIVIPQSDVQAESSEGTNSNANGASEVATQTPSNAAPSEGHSGESSSHARQPDMSQPEQPTTSSLPPEGD